MNNDPNLYEGQKLVKDANGFFMKMYGYMAAAVGISAVTAFMAANVPSVVSLVSNGLVMSILFIMQLVLVFRMSSLKAIRTSGKALSSLIFYSMIEGLFLSGLLYKYTAMDITRAFIAAAVLFVVLAVMGTSTKKDLSGIGRQALAALIALIIVSIVNLFLHSTMIQYVFSFIGIVVFSVLTAYDSQTYKVMSKSSRTSYEQRFWEMNDSKSWLDQKLGQKTKYLYYPVGRGNNQTTIAVQKSGYARATTTQPGSANAGEGIYGLKKVRIVPNISDSGFVQLISTGCWKHAVALFGVDRIFLL